MTRSMLAPNKGEGEGEGKGVGGEVDCRCLGRVAGGRFAT